MRLQYSKSIILLIAFSAFSSILFLLKYPAIAERLTKSVGYVSQSSALGSGSCFKPGEVVMITASAGENGMASIPGMKEMVYENRASYAQRWGYEFLWANITAYDFGPKVYWNKIPIIREALDRFPKAKWVWWLDLDIILMTPSLDLHSHMLSNEGMMQHMLINKTIVGVGGSPIGFQTLLNPLPDSINFIITQDHWGQNVGSFLMRRDTWTDWVLEMWSDPLATKMDWIFPENDGWTHLFKNHKIVRDHVAIVDQRSLNAYPSYNPLGESWQAGDFLVHFAGCGNKTECHGHWNEMWQQREHYAVPESVQEELTNGTAKIETMVRGDYLITE